MFHIVSPFSSTPPSSRDRLLPPQILCIHLKRFRHELMFSTKIGTHVSFPLDGLDLQPFLGKDSAAQTTSYDLLSVICHHGTASSESARRHTRTHTHTDTHDGRRSGGPAPPVI